MTSSDRLTVACPDDETLTAYVEGLLDEAQRDTVEGHVAACPACLDVVAASVPDRFARSAMPSASATTPERFQRRRRRIGGGWAVAASLALLLGGLFTAASSLPGLGSGLSRLASGWLGTPLTIESVAFHGGKAGTFVVGLREVRLGGTEDLFRADEVEVTVALSALAAGTVPVRQIRLVRPVVELKRPETLGIVGAPDGGGRVLAALGDLDRVDVVDGRLMVRGAPGVEAVNGGLVRDAEGAKIALQGRAGPGLVTVDGRVSAGRSALTIGAWDVQVGVLPGLADRIGGTADLRVDLSGTGSDVRVDGRLVVRQGRLIGHGRLGLLDDDVATLIAAKSPAFAGGDLTFDEARTVFRWRHGVWRLPRFFMTGGGIVVGGQARLERGTLTGHGTMRIPIIMADVLVGRFPELATDRDVGGAFLPFVLSGSREAPKLSMGTR